VVISSTRANFPFICAVRAIRGEQIKLGSGKTEIKFDKFLNFDKLIRKLFGGEFLWKR
jgi:hypothetical protein